MKILAVLAVALFGILLTTRAADATEVLHIGHSTIEVVFEEQLQLPHPEIKAWVRRAGLALSNYFGGYPVKHVTITISPGGTGVDGTAYGASRISIRLGTINDLNRDWVLVHEMFHLAFPTVKRRYEWMTEGLSDYLEPLARGRAGQLTDEEVWREYVEGLPQGLPGPGDRGLDNTHTRERIYWGGNLYWLLADVQIREQTNNHRSVDDAIRTILHDGGNGSAEWPLEKILDVGDKATGTTVLKDLHNQLGPQPGNVDLDALWKKLGVVYNNGTITFDDAAPLARIRASITARSK